jgi:hypothetical protein
LPPSSTTYLKKRTKEQHEREAKGEEGVGESCGASMPTVEENKTTTMANTRKQQQQCRETYSRDAHTYTRPEG